MAVMTDMASAVVVGVVEVLRYSMLVAGVSKGSTVLKASRVSGRLELLLNSSVLVVAEVVNLVGVLAVDNLTAMAIAMTAVTVSMMAEMARVSMMARVSVMARVTRVAGV